LVFILGALAAVRFLIGGSEDTWICENGTWIKHGNPSASMPTSGCGEVSQEPNPNNESSEEPRTPDIVLLDVPFFAQAPFGQWENPIYQNACEEASLLMADLWIKGIESISKQEVTDELKKIADFEQGKYGNFYDTSMADTAQLMRDYFNYNNIEVKEDIGIDDIINELLNGNLVITPMNGQILGNPNYTPPGPAEHMLSIIGYDFRTKEFITNDVGTRQGEKFRYDQDVLWRAIRDYPTGNKEPILEINKVMLVVKK